MALTEHDFSLIAACPNCGHALESRHDGLFCPGCLQQFSRRDGIWQFLSERQREQYAPFLSAYHRLRDGDGWKRTDPAYCLALPSVPEGDPQAAIWRIRRRSVRVLDRYLMNGTGAWALDLGAGNCWLSNHIAGRGYNVIAVDINASVGDGLRGGQIYLDNGAAFVRIQASIEHRFPLHDKTIGLCIVNAAFHYVDPHAALTAIRQVLKDDGLLIIMDSPVYSHKSSGVQMMNEQLERFESRYGIQDLNVNGRGYLVRDEIVALLRREGFHVELIWTENIFRRQFHLLRQRIRREREHATFPIIVCRKA